MSLSRAIVTSRCQVPLNLSTDGARAVSYTHLDVYKRQEISKWVMQVDNYLPDMAETLQSQRDEANRLFAKYIIKEYEGLSLIHI